MRVALVTVLLTIAPAYGFQLSPTDRSAGTLEGRVLEARSGDRAIAIKKALVILKRGQEPGIGTYSDEKGNFQLQVEPGAYALTVERDGFVTDPPSAPRTVTVQAGETTRDVTLELVRTGAVSGRIIDADGEPIPRASVQLLSIRNKKRATGLAALTDDRGDYRIFQVPPGKYRLSAAFQPRHQVAEVKLQTPQGVAEESYTTTYFPGTTDPTKAAQVEVGRGADLAGINLRLERLRAVRVRGRVTGLEVASLPIVMIALEPAGGRLETARSTLIRSPNGVFELAGVLPGKYVLSAQAPDLSNNGVGAAARRVVEVGQADLEGIQLTLAAPQKVTGAVVAPAGREVPPGVLVLLSHRESGNRQGGGLGRVGPDGTFNMPEVAAGDYDVALASTGPESDLYVSAIRMGDDDVLAHGLHVNGPPSEPIEIILKANGGTVEIRVRTPKGEPLPDAQVVLLPDVPRREQVALYATCTADARGLCTLRGVTPGDYHGFAFAKDVNVDFRDPESTTDAEKLARPVKVTEGSHQSFELEVSPEDP